MLDWPVYLRTPDRPLKISGCLLWRSHFILQIVLLYLSYGVNYFSPIMVYQL